MTFAEQLRSAMGEMTQTELARLSGLPQVTISRYLRGANTPNLDRLHRLEKALPKLRELRSVGVA